MRAPTTPPHNYFKSYEHSKTMIIIILITYKISQKISTKKWDFEIFRFSKISNFFLDFEIFRFSKRAAYQWVSPKASTRELATYKNNIFLKCFSFFLFFFYMCSLYPNLKIKIISWWGEWFLEKLNEHGRFRLS